MMISRFKCPHCNGNGTIEAPLEELREGFYRFWDLYPNKANQVAAKREWLGILPSKELLEKIINALQQQIDDDHFGDYWPYARTYLKDKRWEDLAMNIDAIEKWMRS